MPPPNPISLKSTKPVDALVQFVVKIPCTEEAIDQLHKELDLWQEHPSFKQIASTNLFPRLQLAIHEWIANLVQHASFPTENKEAIITLTFTSPKQVSVEIKDFSNGFDFINQIETQRERRQEDYFLERGFGLLFLETLVDKVDYKRAKEGINYLTFQLSTDNDACLNFPF